MSKLDELVQNINACDTRLCDVYVCPSTLHVSTVVPKITSGALVTPQDCNSTGCGAFTGSMSVAQMKDMGITQVMIGHSERRGEFGIFKMDDDSSLAAKLKCVLDAGMSCIYCIGEPKEVRERGLPATLELMDVQLRQIYHLLDPARVVIAYEPVWAIGTGLTATPADAQATHAGIRELIASNASRQVADAIRIQYGGSANAKNAPELSAQPDIDGFLVGGASLKPEFPEIVRAISEVKGVPPRFTVSPEIFERLMRGEQVPEEEIMGNAASIAPLTTLATEAATTETAMATTETAKKAKKSKKAKVSKKSKKGCC
jgi:triosephosphate isomerase